MDYLQRGLSRDLANYKKVIDAVNEFDRQKREAENRQDQANRSIIKQEELLQQIADNTSYIKDVVEINRQTQLNTEELTYVMRAIYEVAKANSKEEADSFFTKAINTINSSGETANNIVLLTGILVQIYNTVLSMCK